MSLRRRQHLSMKPGLNRAQKPSPEGILEVEDVLDVQSIGFHLAQGVV